jgi:hypothetical protein
VFLGRTGNTGDLTTSFTEAGGYLLLATKPRYLPARTRIMIGSRPEPLDLQVQGHAKVGEEVPVHVMQRSSSDPVGGVSVWALTRSDAEAFRQEMTGLNDTGASLTKAELSASIGLHGMYLGATDERGNLVTGFNQPRGWVLVTWKPGYLPGFGIIQIIALDTDRLRRSDRPDAAQVAPAPDEPTDQNGTGNATAPATGNVTIR